MVDGLTGLPNRLASPLRIDDGLAVADARFGVLLIDRGHNGLVCFDSGLDNAARRRVHITSLLLHACRRHNVSPSMLALLRSAPCSLPLQSGVLS